MVDEEALVEHLKHNPMFRVGLDVFEDEPYMKPGLADMASFCIKGTYVFIIFFIHGHHSFIHMIFFLIMIYVVDTQRNVHTCCVKRTGMQIYFS